MIAARLIITAVLGYFLGNIQFGLIISKRYGVNDLRKVGSGGTGATNVLRNIGLSASLQTLVLDAAKAAAAGVLGWLILGGGMDRIYGAMLGGLAAVVGHNWPVLYGFKGGKGVAASFGAVIVVSPGIGLVAMILWAAMVAVLRIVSISSIVVAFGAAVALVVFNWGNAYFLAFSSLLFLMILYCHRENITRLKNGTEKTISLSKKL